MTASILETGSGDMFSDNYSDHTEAALRQVSLSTLTWHSPLDTRWKKAVSGASIRQLAALQSFAK